TTRAVAVIGAALLAWWMYQGVAFAVRFPAPAPPSSASEQQLSAHLRYAVDPRSSRAGQQFPPKLYDGIATLPADARILTNNPQRVWWFTDREPTQMGFTRPRTGTSHCPIAAADTVHEACTGHTYLAGFNGLLNAGITPQERRPDVAALVDLK